MRSQQEERGFTLLEILVFTAIFLVVTSGVYLMYYTQHTTFTRGKTKIDVQQHARTALETLAREIRMAGFDPSGAIPLQTAIGQPASAVQQATGTLVGFIADVDGNGTSDQVVYQFQDNPDPTPDQIIRTVRAWGGANWGGATQSALADNVTTFALTYFDGSSNPGPPLANIRLVTLQVNVAETAGGRTETIRVDTNVRLRNLLP